MDGDKHGSFGAFFLPFSVKKCTVYFVLSSGARKWDRKYGIYGILITPPYTLLYI